MRTVKSKFLYVNEFELHATIKQVFPFLATPLGLEAWFADKVEALTEKTFLIHWNAAEHPAKMAARRKNSYVCYEFEDSENPKAPKSYIKMSLSWSALTERTYLNIEDFSDMEDEQELDDLWEDLVAALQEVLYEAHPPLLRAA